MQEPGYPNELDSRKALRSITVRFAAAVGVSALVALFFVVIVPASRQADGEASGPSGIVQSIKAALFQPSETDSAPPPPATSEFKSLLTSAQASNPAPQGQSGQFAQAVHAMAAEACSCSAITRQQDIQTEEAKMPENQPAPISRSLI